MTIECGLHNSRQQARLTLMRLKTETHLCIRQAEEDINIQDRILVPIKTGLNATQVNRKKERIQQ